MGASCARWGCVPALHPPHANNRPTAVTARNAPDIVSWGSGSLPLGNLWATAKTKLVKVYALDFTGSGLECTLKCHVSYQSVPDQKEKKKNATKTHPSPGALLFTFPGAGPRGPGLRALSKGPGCRGEAGRCAWGWAPAPASSACAPRPGDAVCALRRRPAPGVAI